MNFEAFQNWREQSLRSNPGLLDCGETNLYRSLATLQPKPAGLDASRPVHRCDLARAWLAYYGFSQNESRRALVCQGVRHALNLIFEELRKVNAALWIPRDVYPVYLEMARAAGLEHRLFETLPAPQLPAARPAGGAEYLLITNPWKPLGRYLTGIEADALLAWLGESPRRYLLMDCVYDLNTPFHATTLKLYKSGRAILLHSVTKGWLWPKTFGVALVSENHSQFESAFRANSPSLEQLRLAQQFLSKDIHCPQRVSAAVQSRAKTLFSLLPASVWTGLLLQPYCFHSGCYLFPVNVRAEDLLRQYQLLAIPASAFGATWNGSVLSSLAPAFSSSQNGAAYEAA